METVHNRSGVQFANMVYIKYVQVITSIDTYGIVLLSHAQILH